MYSRTICTSCFFTACVVKKQEVFGGYALKVLNNLIPNSVIYGIEPVSSRLEQLGLSIGVLQNAVYEAFLAYSNCSELDPPMFAGLTMWARTIRSLRFALVPQGWDISNSENYCVVISPGSDVAVAVATGDENTGIRNQTPTTRSEKGPKTANGVEQNIQMELRLELTLSNVPNNNPLVYDDQDPKTETWILLFYRDTHEIRLELSKPVHMDESARVCGWRERILLPSIPVERDIPDLSMEQEAPDFEVLVERRS